MEGLDKMKLVIMAGGLGTRIGEETRMKPKPMVEIGGKPILWHIMKWYSKFGINQFIICCGYRGHIIKRYFLDYYKNSSDLIVNLKNGEMRAVSDEIEPWKVTLINTGRNTLTAGRLLKIKKYVSDSPFLLTYGDGVSDVNIDELISFHRKQGKVVTISTMQPEGRFGALKINSETDVVNAFKEKARSDQSWVNIGFMVMNPEVFDYLGDGNEMLEASPFERLASEGKMVAYRHKGFWSPMDTVHDRDYLETIWNNGAAPWKV